MTQSGDSINGYTFVQINKSAQKAFSRSLAVLNPVRCQKLVIFLIAVFHLDKFDMIHHAHVPFVSYLPFNDHCTY